MVERVFDGLTHLLVIGARGIGALPALGQLEDAAVLVGQAEAVDVIGVGSR